MTSHSVEGLNHEPPLSLYIHLPWCVKKCPYCDFNSHEFRSATLAEKTYTRALIQDLEYSLPGIVQRQITSVFIGGGTPSLFSAAALAEMLHAVRARFSLKPETEITLEANPGTAEAERFKVYREIGINRLSIGVQSFDDGKLSSLGRIHDGNEALRAIGMAVEAGFKNINIDLMFGLPGQTLDEALTDLRTACAQPVTHISWYQLTIEANTVFYRYPPPLPVDDELWKMQMQGLDFLNDEGFDQYEISACARTDRQCHHNLNYWRFGDYLGIGAGAHSKLTDAGNNQIRRFVRHRLPEAYMQKAGGREVIVEERPLAREDVILEFMMNALRLREGFSSSLFSAHTGLEIEDIRPLLDIAGTRGFILLQGDVIKATEIGKNHLNELLQIFMPPD